MLLVSMDKQEARVTEAWFSPVHIKKLSLLLKIFYSRKYSHSKFASSGCFLSFSWFQYKNGCMLIKWCLSYGGPGGLHVYDNLSADSTWLFCYLHGFLCIVSMDYCIWYCFLMLLVWCLWPVIFLCCVSFFHLQSNKMLWLHPASLRFFFSCFAFIRIKCKLFWRCPPSFSNFHVVKLALVDTYALKNILCVVFTTFVNVVTQESGLYVALFRAKSIHFCNDLFLLADALLI